MRPDGDPDYAAAPVPEQARPDRQSRPVPARHRCRADITWTRQGGPSHQRRSGSSPSSSAPSTSASPASTCTYSGLHLGPGLHSMPRRRRPWPRSWPPPNSAPASCWGFISERVSVRRATAHHVRDPGRGPGGGHADTAATDWGCTSAFFLYGSGLGGAHVLQEVMWANYFGRISLGTVRGLSLPILLLCAAIGSPVLRLPLRLHRQLRPLPHPLHRRADPVRGAHPAHQAADEGGIGFQQSIVFG